MEVGDPGSMNQSTGMAALIDVGDVKRKCVETPFP